MAATLRTLATTSSIPAQLVTEDGNPFYVQEEPVGEGFALQYVFVLKPGAIQQGNVYADSNNLFAAVLAQRAVSGDSSAIIIEIDGSIAPVTWLANGVQNMSGVTLFTSQVTPQGFTMTLADGVQWAFDTLTNDSVTVISTGGTTPVTIAGGVTSFFNCINEAGFSSAGGAPFFAVLGGGNLQGVASFSFLGDGVNPAFLVNGGGSLTLTLFDFSSLTGHAIRSTSLGSITILSDASSGVTPQDAPLTPTLQLIDIASQVGFSAHVPADWNPVPTTVNAALDQLAKQNIASKVDPGQAAATTITIPGNPITQAKTGAVTVSGSASLTFTGDTVTLTAQLVRDATPIGPVLTAIASTTTFPMSITWADTLPTGGAAHTYSMKCTASGGTTLTTAAGSGGVSVIET